MAATKPYNTFLLRTTNALKITITNTHKFEGLTLYKNNAKSLEFLLCEDQDNEVMVSQIFKLTLNK